MTAAEYRDLNAAGGAISSPKKRKNEKVEAGISKACGDILDARGIWNTRTNSGSVPLAGGGYMKLCRPGTPDRLFVWEGLTVWLEVKKPGGKLSDDQADTIKKLERAGNIVFIIDNPDQLIKILDGMRTLFPGTRDAIIRAAQDIKQILSRSRGPMLTNRTFKIFTDVSGMVFFQVSADGVAVQLAMHPEKLDPGDLGGLMPGEWPVLWKIEAELTEVVEQNIELGRLYTNL